MNGIRQLIYLSTSAVVWSGKDIKNGDEQSLRSPTQHIDPYVKTKAQAEELVLQANGQTGLNGQVLSTCALRPANVFGPGDTHLIPKLVDRARQGKLTHMIGDGRNVVDFTYVANVAHAAVMAASRLHPQAPAAGQAYFITNGEPRPFWSFVSHVLTEVGCIAPSKRISFQMAYLLTWLMETTQSLLGRLGLRFSWLQPSLSRHTLSALTGHRWFCHGRATQDLGYRPIVSLAQGLQATVQYLRLGACRAAGTAAGTTMTMAMTLATTAITTVVDPNPNPFPSPHLLHQQQQHQLHRYRALTPTTTTSCASSFSTSAGSLSLSPLPLSPSLRSRQQQQTPLHRDRDRLPLSLSLSLSLSPDASAPRTVGSSSAPSEETATLSAGTRTIQ